MFAFFTVIARRPLLSREHTHHHHHLSSSPPPPSRREETKRPNNKTKENKIVPLSQKKGGPSCPFFVAWTQIFFSRRKYLDPSSFFSANTLNVPKTLNKKFKKKVSGVPQEKRLSLCVCLTLSLSSNHVARPKAEEQQQHTASSSSS